MTTNNLLKHILGVDAISGYVSHIDQDGRAVCYLNNVGVTMPSYFPKGDLEDGDSIKIIILKEE